MHADTLFAQTPNTFTSLLQSKCAKMIDAFARKSKHGVDSQKTIAINFHASTVDDKIAFAKRTVPLLWTFRWQCWYKVFLPYRTRYCIPSTSPAVWLQLVKALSHSRDVASWACVNAVECMQHFTHKSNRFLISAGFVLVQQPWLLAMGLSTFIHYHWAEVLLKLIF